MGGAGSRGVFQTAYIFEYWSVSIITIRSIIGVGLIKYPFLVYLILNTPVICKYAVCRYAVISLIYVLEASLIYYEALFREPELCWQQRSA